MIEYENLKKLNECFFETYQLSFSQFLNSGWFILGDRVAEFEENFSKYCGAGKFVGVASGLDALFLSLKALNLPKDSEILVPSNTYIATIIAVLQAGLKPVLVEPRLDTYNINPDLIEERINTNTRAIMPVHLYGKACEMGKICAIAKRYELYIIEDCAQAHGAKYREKKVGTFGDFGAFSFYPTKNLGALGDGGGILTKSEEHEKNIKRMRNYGSDIKYYNEILGFNSRLDEIQAVFLNIKLKKLDEINSHKRKLAELYLTCLKEDFIKPVVDIDFFDVYHIFNIRHPKRDLIKEFLLKKGIKTEIHYPVPPHRQKAMNQVIKESSFPISTEIHNTTLSLPISYFHSESDIKKVIEELNSF